MGNMCENSEMEKSEIVRLHGLHNLPLPPLFVNMELSHEPVNGREAFGNAKGIGKEVGGFGER